MTFLNQVFSVILNQVFSPLFVPVGRGMYLSYNNLEGNDKKTSVKEVAVLLTM
jgi:hypothetical protein